MTIAKRFAPLAAALLVVMTSCSDSVDYPLAPTPLNIFAPYLYPAWHPSGRSLVFELDPLVRRYRDARGKWVYVYSDSPAGEYIVNIDGSGQRRILPYSLLEPEWDSAGATLAYQRGGIAIATMAGFGNRLVVGKARQNISGSTRGVGPTSEAQGRDTP